MKFHFKVKYFKHIHFGYVWLIYMMVYVLHPKTMIFCTQYYRCWFTLLCNSGNEFWSILNLNSVPFEMLSWLYVYTGGRLTFIELGRGYTQEDTLTVCLCYHTDGKLIFNWQFAVHPLTYTYSQHNISNINADCILQVQGNSYLAL